MSALVLLGAEKFWILDPLYSALGTLVAWFYSLIPSYGVAIMLLTLAVRVVTLPLTAKQARSQQQMQQLQPELKRLQAKYKHDKQKLNEEMMKFYRENHANPFGGCLPVLIQAPILIVLYRLILGLSDKDGPKNVPSSSALFTALKESGGKMVSWGMDLAQSAANVSGAKQLPFLLLVALVVATGYFQQRQLTARVSKENINPQMAMMTKVFPVMFGFISYTIPAGVVVYFLVSNIWQIGQQAVLFRNQPLPPGAGKGAEDAAKKGTTSTKGKAGQPAKGKAPVKGRAGTPAKGKSGTPAKGGKAGSPAKGKSGTPAKGRAGAPAKGRAGTPGKGKAGAPPKGGASTARGPQSTGPGARGASRRSSPKGAPARGQQTKGGAGRGTPSAPATAPPPKSVPAPVPAGRGWWARLVTARGGVGPDPASGAPEPTATAEEAPKASSAGGAPRQPGSGQGRRKGRGKGGPPQKTPAQKTPTQTGQARLTGKQQVDNGRAGARPEPKVPTDTSQGGNGTTGRSAPAAQSDGQRTGDGASEPPSGDGAGHDDDVAPTGAPGDDVQKGDESWSG